MTTVPLRVKAAVVFVLLAAIPAVVTGILLWYVNVDAVRTSERQLQTAVLSELSAFTDLKVAAAQDDVRALAEALAAEARSNAVPSFDGVRAVLKTTRYVSSARLLIPESDVDVTLLVGDEGVPAAPPLKSLSAVLPDTVQPLVSQAGAVDLVARLPVASEEAPVGYVVARMNLLPLRQRLERASVARLGGAEAVVLLVGEAKQPLLTYGPFSATPDAIADLPVWRLGSGKSGAEFAIVGELQIQGQSVLAGVESLPRLGWQVVVWRPTKEAYATLSTMIQRAGLAATCATILALLLGLLAATRLTRPILEMAEQAQLIGQRAWGQLRLLPTSNDELGQLAASLDEMAGALKQSEFQIGQEIRLRTDLSRYMSRALVEQIVRGDVAVSKGEEQQNVTVLFGSVVSFTSLAEEAKSEDIVALLNELYAILTEIVFRNGGIVDKFFGDSVMAAWGTPHADARHATNALEAAEEILRFVSVASDDWQRRFGSRVRMAIGINTGTCIAGNLGSDKRMEYTVIGDTVNVAARLEREAAPGQVLITEATKEAALGFDYTFIGEHRLSGRQGLSRVYALEVGS